MTTNQVLTDAELRACWDNLQPLMNVQPAYGRAVEQAVLAKVNADVRKAQNYLHYDGAKWWCNGQQMVTEREARKRERAAFDAGVDYGSSLGYTNYCINPLLQKKLREERRDALYPSPTCDKCGQELK